MMVKNKIFIKFIVLILFFNLLIMGSSHNDFAHNKYSAYATGDRLFRVGLKYGVKDKIVESVASADGFDLSIIANGSVIGKYHFTDSNKIEIFNIDSYHIEVGKTYSDYEEAINAIKNKYNGCYAGYYDETWHICYGRYKSKQEANNDINLFSSVKVKIISNNGIAIYVKGKRRLIYDNSSLKFIFSSPNIDDSSIKYADKKYKGGIGFRYKDKKFSVINYIDIDEYLCGVVPKEMSGDWEIEALKAQAVAARTFAIASINKHSEYGFDVCNTTDCQVYGGYDAQRPVSNQAVNETRGKLLYYKDNLVSAYYHANSGGYTASMENVWDSKVPYIVGVADPYSMDKPRSTWELRCKKSELTSKLNNAGYHIGEVKGARINDVSSDGRVQSFSFIGTKGEVTFKKEKLRAFLGYTKLKSIYFQLDGHPIPNLEKIEKNEIKDSSDLEYGGIHEEFLVSVLREKKYEKINIEDASYMTVDGVVLGSKKSEYAVIDEKGSSVINSSNNQNVDNTRQQLIKNNNIIHSTLKVKLKSPDKPPTSDEIVFYGCGYGHGLGMSQWGAKTMAELGMNYIDILTHYYRGTHVSE